MNSSAVAGLCRLRFRTPERVFELAVPVDVPIADLLPAVLGYAGPEVEEKGADHGGWVLQRLGGEPLDEELAPDALDLQDGDELHLRPRREALPPVHFDDLVDGVATGMQERGDSWRPRLTHHFALAMALTALAGGLALLLLPGATPVRELAALVTGVLLLAGATSASRAVGDAGAGIALGSAAVPFLALAGALLPSGGSGRSTRWPGAVGVSQVVRSAAAPAQWAAPSASSRPRPSL
ncbi:type VII secretion integral membrane protein EccD, partial [Kitasatospora sp. LaBMicrA B282]|uniref:type VII secretion integral membrane protein EccD n=1 Tax=Kitasatospora sp. LaBMicrA B282 TaxID=3420949 RepID=UPI003D12EAC5